MLLLADACVSLPGGVASPRDLAVARRARLLRIEDTRRDEPAYIDSLLTDADETARAQAALAVGRIGARSHLVALRRLAIDPDSGVAANALFALGLLKDTAAGGTAVLALRRANGVAVEAAWLLGELGEAGRPVLVAALRDSSTGAPARGALLLAAARLRPVPADVVVPWVASTDSGLAWRAAYALARGRSASGVRALLAVRGSSAAAVREQVARGLGRSITGDSLGAAAQLALSELLTDPDARVRVNAVRTLASYGSPTRARIVGALGDRDANVRVAAAQSLDLVMDSSATGWADAFGRDTALVVQRAVADAAVKRSVGLEGVRAWRTSPDWQRRAAAAELDGRGPAAVAVERLSPWLSDRDGRVRAAAAGTLAGLGDSVAVGPAVRRALRRSLADGDVAVRTAALAGLASGATEDDLRAALGAYAIARTDADNDARLAFWTLADSALRRSRGVVADSLARRLDAIPLPADPLERTAAARNARFAAWRDSAGTAQPLGWYETRAREVMNLPRPVARIETERGSFDIALFAPDAPLTVYNFVALARRGYFDGQRFVRVVPNFVVQGGDPRGDGYGGPGHAIRDELNRRRYLRGTLGMALSGPNTGGSQFFVTHSPQPHLDGGYTVFGQLASGGDVLDRIVQGDRIVRIVIR